jgi:cation diffusion facilitator CzcD-associated flavoprotein CzcO
MAAGAAAPHEERGTESKSRRRARVAVVGAGAAGLAAARELAVEGHSVVVYEKGGDVGGVWMYDANVESDTLGTDPGRARVHGTLTSQTLCTLPPSSMHP